MKKIVVASFLTALLAGMAAAQDGPPMPKPQKEHEWLQQLVGEWETEGEAILDPSQPPIKTRGTESGRMVGGFFALLENKGDFMGTPFTGVLTLGYSPERKKYMGTWFDSMTSYLWHYQGGVDASGKILTLDTEGPCHDTPGRLGKFRETIELKSKDHKVFTSSLERDGTWTTFLTIHYKRKK